tara:strand:+ start:31 stop:423 length:393 start_codon:yes stop_codon:yes gene_type:complete
LRYSTLKLRQTRKDIVALMFSGSHKSLTLGMPILMAMFGESVPAFIVLPLLVYHPSQIILGSLLAPRCAQFIQEGDGDINKTGIELKTAVPSIMVVENNSPIRKSAGEEVVQTNLIHSSNSSKPNLALMV